MSERAAPHPPVAVATGPPSPAVRERDAAASRSLSRTAGEGAGGRSPKAGEGVPRPTTLGSAIADAAAALAASGFDEPRRRARRLLAAALDLTPAEIFAHPERPLSAAPRARIAALLRRVMAHEPLSRIVGVREFWGLEYLLSADTLDPRPETETVIEAVLASLPERNRPYRFLDLGTGTGCLLLALLSEFPYAIGLGVDIAAGAASMARHNAERLGCAGRACFAVGDWAQAVAGRFDVVVANPPYIATPAIATLAPEVRDYDPRCALDGGADGLAAYRAIAAELRRLLRPGGLFAAELGSGQAESVAAILTQHGLAVGELRPDLAGIPRCIVAQA